MLKSSSSPSISSYNYFDTFKWKKRLQKLSHKLHPSGSHDYWQTASATTLAAATEKFIRKSHKLDTDIVIHSEDLTASQFAHLTGIDRTRKRASGSSSYYYSSSTTDFEDSDDSDSENGYHHYATTTVGPTAMCIWDYHFWQSATCKNLPIATPLVTKDEKEATHDSQLVENVKTRDNVITRTVTSHSVQKGRFKIVWGQEDDDDSKTASSAPSSHCVEWKRKRASSRGSVSSKESSTTLFH
ncbi:MAG: hypothetical protein EXX96DRAFT_548286 [Benjaminiella poitrasii]|nr:MAG: hypothetical protein EXX96DRAFT_548286 [Benjaminiella poitrasii]